MYINVTEIKDGKEITHQETVGGLLLNCDQMYPHELREGSKTASSEIFELLREVSLNRRTKVTLANGKQVMRSEGLLGLWVRYHDSPLAVATTIVNLIAQFKWLKNPHTKKILRLALHTVNAQPAEPPAAAAQMLDIDEHGGVSFGRGTRLRHPRAIRLDLRRIHHAQRARRPLLTDGLR